MVFLAYNNPCDWCSCEYKYNHAVYLLRTQRSLATEQRTGKNHVLLVLENISSQQLYVGSGESPRTWGRECQPRRCQFSSRFILAKKRLLSHEERGRCLVEAQLCGVISSWSTIWWRCELDGAYFAVSQTFLHLRKSMIFMLWLVCEMNPMRSSSATTC